MSVNVFGAGEKIYIGNSRQGVRLAGGGNPWGSRVPDSSDSSLLSGQDSVVAVNDGSSYLYFGKIGATWKLLWVDRTGALLRGDALGTTAVTVASGGPSPFDTAYEFATQRLAGSVAQGTTFVHEADCVIEFVLTTLPVGDVTLFSFRQIDAANRWYFNIGAAGNIALVENVANTPTGRGQANGVLANGHRVVTVPDTSTIPVYSNDVLRITYASATNFATATVGAATYIPASSGLSDVISWPRQITGAVASLLDMAAA